MTIPNKQFLDGMHEHQIDVFNAFDDGLARFFIMEWHRRARKTTKAVNLLVREACTYPKVKYVYVAPTQVMARNIVWDDPTMLRNALPDKSEMGWERNEQKMMVTFDNGSVLKIGGSDNPDSLRGIDAIGVCFDEWSLIKENTWTEIFRPIMAGSPPQHLKDSDAFRWAMFLYTPKGINHATIMMDKACCLESGGELPSNGKALMLAENWFASRLTADKSGIMTKEAVALAKSDMPLVMFEQELLCNRTTQEERTLITSDMLQKLREVEWDLTKATFVETRRIVSIDPAFGGDICDMKAMENTEIEEHKKFHPHMTHEIIAEAKMMAQRLGTKNFIVDCIGNGKGIADGLASDEAGYNVIYFNSSESPSDKEMQPKGKKSLFKNKKAEAAYIAAGLIKSLRVHPIEDRELLRQVTIATRYDITSSGQIQLMSKDLVKKELGCSPDNSDSYIMGLYGLTLVDPVNAETMEEESVSGLYF